MPCFEAEFYRLSPYSKQITKSMGIEHVFNMYNQIIVYFNDIFMRIAITGFLRGGLGSGHYEYGKYVGELLPGSKQLKTNKTRCSKEPVSLTLVYVNIKQWTQMDS